MGKITHASLLYRVLRLLTAVDLFTEGEAHSFALTPLGVYLQSGVPGSLRHMALAYGEKPFWPVWGALLHSVETGEPSFQHVFGLKMFDYYARTPKWTQECQNVFCKTKRLFFVRLVGKSKGSETEHLAFDKPQLRLRRPVWEKPPSPSHDEGQD